MTISIPSLPVPVDPQPIASHQYGTPDPIPRQLPVRLDRIDRWLEQLPHHDYTDKESHREQPEEARPASPRDPYRPAARRPAPIGT